MHSYMPNQTEPAFSLSFRKGQRRSQGEGDAHWGPPQYCWEQAGPASPTGRLRATGSTALPSPSHPWAYSHCTGPLRALPRPTSWFPGGEGPVPTLSRSTPPTPVPAAASPAAAAFPAVSPAAAGNLSPSRDAARARMHAGKGPPFRSQVRGFETLPGPAAGSGCLPDGVCRGGPCEYVPAVTCTAFRQTQYENGIKLLESVQRGVPPLDVWGVAEVPGFAHGNLRLLTGSRGPALNSALWWQRQGQKEWHGAVSGENQAGC